MGQAHASIEITKWHNIHSSLLYHQSHLKYGKDYKGHRRATMTHGKNVVKMILKQKNE